MASADSIQATAIGFASGNVAAMDAFAQAAAGFAFQTFDLSSSWRSPGYVIGYNGGAVLPPATITVPEVTATRPADPELMALSTITLPTAPELLAAEPVINLPVKPSSALPVAPGATPAFNSPAIPDAPAFALPAVPTFAPVAVPVAPALDSVTFSATLTADDLAAPSNTFAFAEQEYQSALLDSLKAKLISDLANGGYGIETADESGLWERLRERELVAMNAAIDEVSRLTAARGMTLPPGALNAAIARAQQEAMAKISSASRDIAIKRADLYVENRKFTISEVRQVEDMLVRVYGAMMERALNAAKALVELGIAGFNAQLAKHSYRLDRYKADAAVYEAMIRGQIAKVEQYKAQVEGAKLSADIQRIHADVYRIQLDGVNALVNIYRTEMDAAKVASEIEQFKLQGFKLSVEAYAAQVGAKTAEFSMYEAGVKGEMAKVSIYDAQVRAYGTTVDTYKTKVEAQDVLVRSQVAANQGRIDAYRADIGRYTAELGASQNELSAAVAKYEADVRKYSVTADATIRSSQQNVEAGKANADVAVAHAQVIASSAINAGQVMASKAAAAGNTMAAIASAYGTAAAGAMSAATGIEATITNN